MSWEEAVTNYVKERMQSVTWANRDYIDDLATIEAYIMQDGPTGWSANLLCKSLQRRYPVDFCLIQAELAAIRKASPERYEELRATRARQRNAIALRERRFKEQEQELRRRREAEEKALWLTVGGRA